MTKDTDALTIHQLLGRIVYFHALFIEPALPSGQPTVRAARGEACCNHGAAPGRVTVEELLPGSAWAALVDVAATLPAHHPVCPADEGSCCATCRVAYAGAAIAAGWAQAEHQAYRLKPAPEALVHACGQAAAARLGGVFAAQHPGQHPVLCPALARLTATPVDPNLLPSPHKLPLTGELLALWADPAFTTRHPVASWLNHCTGLDDIRRVLTTRRTGP